MQKKSNLVHYVALFDVTAKFKQIDAVYLQRKYKVVYGQNLRFRPTALLRYSKTIQ